MPSLGLGCSGLGLGFWTQKGFTLPQATTTLHLYLPADIFCMSCPHVFPYFQFLHWW